MKRLLYLLAAAALIIILGMLLIPRGTRPARTVVGKPLTDNEAAPENPAGNTGEGRTKNAGRNPEGPKWRHAKPQREPGDQAPLPDAGIFVNFVQSDPDRKKLRLGFRQEGETLDPSDLVIRVELFDIAGSPFTEDSKIGTTWSSDDKGFEQSPTPILSLDSSVVIGSARVSIIYKGEKMEQLSYEMAKER